MDSLLSKIRDERLKKIVGSIDHTNEGMFKDIAQQFPEYDETFLWVLSYQRDGNERIAEYINANYEKYHQYLDSGFLRTLSSKGNFDSRMWEMILCDVLSSSGKLIEKEKSGADFLLKTPDGKVFQIEAITPNESDEQAERALRFFYSEDNIASLGGEIEDMERPVLLRFVKGFDDKQGRYLRDVPLIIAINSSRAVGTISDDNYVLRRVLFGLGYVTISRNGETGLKQNPLLNKPAKRPFAVGRFRDPKYTHVTGVIYSSQKPFGLIPDSFGWHNHGITFAPNPNAMQTAAIELPFFRQLRCTEGLYEEIDASHKFRSNVV